MVYPIHHQIDVNNSQSKKYLVPKLLIQLFNASKHGMEDSHWAW